MTVYNDTDNDIYAASNDDFKVDMTPRLRATSTAMSAQRNCKKCSMYFSQESEVARSLDTSACTGTISVSRELQPARNVLV